MTAGQAHSMLRDAGCTQLRLAWCDLHGRWHTKTLVPRGFERGLKEGIRVASSLALKDSSGRTAFPVYDAAAMDALGLGAYSNVPDMLLAPDCASLRVLPWTVGEQSRSTSALDGSVAWVRCEARTLDAQPLALDARVQAQRAQRRLRAAGYSMQVGIEIEFHVWRLLADAPTLADLQWPPRAPSADQLIALHPGHQLLGEMEADAAHEVLRIVQHTCDGLALPLSSLEIEFGPSQFEAVFEPQDLADAADTLAIFRSGVAQALARAGYAVSFMCKLPGKTTMASGWHIHQSLIDRSTGENAFAQWYAADAISVVEGSSEFEAGEPMRQESASKHKPEPLSAVGMHAAAGLLAHAAASAAFAVPTINGYSRYTPGALAPTRISWGTDNRAAMLRLISARASSRIENRLPEPLANPYLTLATQAEAMRDGIERRLAAPAAGTGDPLPSTLAQSLQALDASALYRSTFGDELVNAWLHISRFTLKRHEEATRSDPQSASLDEASLRWQRNEYFSL